MNKDVSKGRLIKNEQLIRDRNLSASKGLKRYFRNDKQVRNTPVEFMCECSELNCQESIALTIDRYQQLHKRQDYFTVSRGHAIAEVEKIVDSQNDFDIVEKYALSA